LTNQNAPETKQNGWNFRNHGTFWELEKLASQFEAVFYPAITLPGDL
jgi:hypothetical protein